MWFKLVALLPIYLLIITQDNVLPDVQKVRILLGISLLMLVLPIVLGILPVTIILIGILPRRAVLLHVHLTHHTIVIMAP